MKKNIIIIAILVVVVIGALIAYKACQPEPKKQFKVAIASIVEIEPITQLRKGFRDEFEKSEFAKGKDVAFVEFNAQGDQSLANQIADKIATEKPDLVYVLGTPLAQAIQNRVPDVLLVQGAVTDPVAAGLAQSWEGSGKKYVANSDLPPIPKQIELIKNLTPSVKNLGLIYNTGEANSVAVVSRLREYIQKNSLDINLVERTIANSSEAATAVQTLVGKVDAIYLPPDNTVHTALPVIGKFAKENKIPLYATVSSALTEGAIATLSLDFYELGKESADLGLAVLANGQDPAKMPIKVNENPVITINAKIANSYGIDLSKFRDKSGVKIVE